VHRRVSARLDMGNGPWVADIYVNAQTRQIVSIGQVPPGGVTGTIQVDLVHMKAGQARFAVGETWDHNRVGDLVEIKTSIQGRIINNQLLKLKDLMTDGEVVVTKGTERRWTASQGWHDNVKFEKYLRVLALLGFIKNRNYAAGPSGDGEKLGHVLELHDRISAYLSHFTPDTTAIDVVKLIRVYELIGEQ
jgi:hypothetical protein